MSVTLFFAPGEVLRPSALSDVEGPADGAGAPDGGARLPLSLIGGTESGCAGGLGGAALMESGTEDGGGCRAAFERAGAGGGFESTCCGAASE